MGLGNIGSGTIINPLGTEPLVVSKAGTVEGAQKATGIASLTSDFGPNQYTGVVAQLTGIGAGGVAQNLNLSPAARTEIALIGLGISNGAMSSELQSRWGAFVADQAANGGAVDPNALVQAVLRESYLQTTEDLRFFAEKVKFYNNLKKAIREELTRARDVFAANAKGKDEDALVGGPYAQTTFDDHYYGGTDAQIQALQPAVDTSQLSGRGVQAYNGSPALNPAPGGDCAKFITAGGYVVTFNPGACETNIYGPDGKRISQIWGDPHVSEAARADNPDGIGSWSFGDDSTFVLPDGSKVCLNTEESPAGSGIYVTKGLDLLSGTGHAAAGIGPKGDNRGTNTPVSADRVSFDAANADAANNTSAGVFLMQPGGAVYKANPDGTMSRVASQDWKAYLDSKTVKTEGAALAIDATQGAALVDGQGVSKSTNACNTKKELETYIKDLETKLDSVGDDAQLANVDLQNILQKQTQCLQLISNISKLCHDTAIAIIRKIAS